MQCHQPNNNKIYVYAKDLYERKDQLVINQRESIDLKHCNDSKSFVEYSNYIKYSSTRMKMLMKTIQTKTIDST